ncbi:phage tail protein [Methylobacterium gnaphalii]|uniref:Uncharacterized protein n=1 Tax=Methylobacterium gnaphalii TaxID=1010610 RepID=A0A512JQL2_9HYPH|nr:phage tail protein [Methylobacterium gnaphalii]GEP12250.1 hypothetical protein MGN01_40950 [Methylobacterium gnaphalii]GJD68746.1 hypothetical protein MMMDOFMJ_1670 [Methylobacterium gnaphalii]GLS49357.1 hypothetical protein GCM10007885_22050 [Methylobacterium gnaphalii]
MAEVIGFAILEAVTGVGAGLGGVGATTASVIGSAAILTVSVGGQLLLNELLQPQQRNQSQQSVLNQAMGPRTLGYGRFMAGGTRAFFDARNGSLYQAIVICARRIDGIEKYLIGDKYVETTLGENGGLTLTAPYDRSIAFEPHLGTDDQAASPMLLGAYSDIWTAAHQLKGIAYCVVLFAPVKPKFQQSVYPQSYATPIRFLVRGARIWDLGASSQNPDDEATWSFSENPARCIADYLRHRDGMRFPRSRLDLASFQDMRDVCDETVARKDSTTEPRYRLGGTYQLTEAPKDVLARMCATCDGQLVKGPTGLIGIRGGRFTSPTVNISTKNIRTASLTQGNDRLDAYNNLKVSYTEPGAYYQPTELTARQDTASINKVGQIDSSLDLIMVPSWTQAARLAKIRFAKDNPAWKGTISTDLAALDALGEDTIHLAYDPLGEDDPMLDENVSLNGFTLHADLSGCDLSFASISSEAYAWDAATEEPPRPALPTQPAAVNVIAAPENVTITPSRRTVAGETTQVWGVLTWDAVARTDVLPEPEYRVTGSGDDAWQPMTTRIDGLSAEIGPLVDGETYDFRVGWNAGGTDGAKSNIVTLAAIADATAPGPVTGFVANNGTGQYAYAFIAPNSANFGSAQVLVGTTTNIGDATLKRTLYGGASQAFDKTEPGIAPGTYRIWVKALNKSGYGDSSSTVGPMTVTVT